ncbi:tRNA 2-thiouridine synthesizing protein A [Sphingomonas sp. BK036]|uniref:sulfurtransferase TusA family protein n=1 Tax=Sphingomonas sp. BK036 TaxID=2512122 RepID=UPI0010F0BE55|nr:sulfurtransferase TusA family protein [Sphingomonas sp. BK036]RZT54809.1 tRNA 2-thiouridine synthesizing protein A [Sphingomonas sp. BK036]
MVRIDARGMRCPWPAVRLSRALRDGARSVEVLADDPQAPAELAAVAKASNATLEIILDDFYRMFVVTCR